MAVEADEIRSEPWRCKHCEALIYNVDEQGYPAPGAPQSKFYSAKLNEVCQTCWDVLTAKHDIDYWRDREREHEQSEAVCKARNDRLAGNTDYFSGA